VSVPVVRFAVAGEDSAARAGVPICDAGCSYTVVYDGGCKVCGRMVKVLASWDRGRELEIIPSQTPSAQARFPWIPPRAYAESMQVIRASDGKTWQGAAALEELLKVLPKGRSISWLFKIPFARPVAEKLYRLFARNRYRIGCGEHCAVHPPDLDYRDGGGPKK
jgi:predicted DCC family thiol-disulfide oxidoreductase YuxK